MSVDQALLESVNESQTPVLRWYGWSRPTLSLGYFQSLADRAMHSASQSLDVVRRSTGGGAIVHHHELTYSIAVPIHAGATGARHALYRDVHAAVATALYEFGLRLTPHRLNCGWDGHEDAYLCFQRRTDEDLVAGGYKVLGSAQRRTRLATLQHGSILIRASEFAPELPGVMNLGAKPIDAEPLSSQITEVVASVLDLHWQLSSLSEREQKRAQEIEAERFACERWTTKR